MTTAILDYSQAEITDKLTKENLLENEQFLDDAKRFLVERGGYSATDVQNKEDVMMLTWNIFVIRM